MDRLQSSSGELLDPAAFTNFMGNHHDQNQTEIIMTGLQVTGKMKVGIKRSIKRSRPNKSLGRDGIPNEMLKVEPELLAELLYEVWTLVGRTQVCPK